MTIVYLNVMTGALYAYDVSDESRSVLVLESGVFRVPLTTGTRLPVNKNPFEFSTACYITLWEQ